MAREMASHSSLKSLGSSSRQGHLIARTRSLGCITSQTFEQAQCSYHYECGIFQPATSSRSVWSNIGQVILVC